MCLNVTHVHKKGNATVVWNWWPSLLFSVIFRSLRLAETPNCKPVNSWLYFKTLVLNIYAYSEKKKWIKHCDPKAERKEQPQTHASWCFFWKADKSALKLTVYPELRKRGFRAQGVIVSWWFCGKSVWWAVCGLWVCVFEVEKGELLCHLFLGSSYW